jgi:hypothetical protein
MAWLNGARSLVVIETPILLCTLSDGQLKTVFWIEVHVFSTRVRVRIRFRTNMMRPQKAQLHKHYESGEENPNPASILYFFAGMSAGGPASQGPMGRERCTLVPARAVPHPALLDVCLLAGAEGASWNSHWCNARLEPLKFLHFPLPCDAHRG